MMGWGGGAGEEVQMRGGGGEVQMKRSLRLRSLISLREKLEAFRQDELI